MRTKKEVQNKRLHYLLSEYGNMKSDRELAVKMLQNKECREALNISDHDLDKTNRNPQNGLTPYEQTLFNLTRNINNHLHLPDCSTMKAAYIKAYGIFFGCSADYLLGMIDLPTYEKTDFFKLTGLYDNCINTLIKCKNSKCWDNSFPDYNETIIMLLNFLLYEDKDKLANYDKITLLNDIFNYIFYSDFDSYIDNDGKEQGSHISFTNHQGVIVARLPVKEMHNTIKLNINSLLDSLREFNKSLGFYRLATPDLEKMLEAIKEEKEKIDQWDQELIQILQSNEALEKEPYIGTLERCKGICYEKIHQIKQMIVANYKDLLKQKEFSRFHPWQQDILESIYIENENYITDKI